MKWYTNIRKILKSEPETWLAYLYGQQIDNIPHLTENKPRYRGFPIQLLKFSYILIRTWRPSNFSKVNQEIAYLVFAGTSNQIESLDTTVDALREKKAIVVAIGAKKLLNNQERKERYIPLAFSFTDILRTIFLAMVRGPYLYVELKKLHPQAVNYWFANFCLIYAYLVYFQRVLQEIQPKFVITANDHNIPNRCLLAVAHQLGIKTVYLQHASVSNLFPALRMNYAFLDGQCALDIYQQCENNKPNNRQVPLPEVFLSGQKKLIFNKSKKNIRAIGIALNSLDDVDATVDFVNQLANTHYSIIVRWHPGQAEYDIRKYREEFARNSHITLSEPKSEKVSHFLSKINWLIAGNSSIHLEAALAGVNCIYYELTPASIPDYYGYVKSGLVMKISSVKEVNDLIRHGVGINIDSKNSIRYYSSTYQTEWEGQEGELVAETLECLRNGMNTPIDSTTISI